MRSWSGWAAAAAVGLLLVLGLAPPAMAQPDIPAFPGAEGFGAIATGGRGGDVVIVDTLEPYGPGSFGEALDPEDCRPRIVVFAVSGVIEGEFDLTCGNVTIAGQTAPGAGITIRGRVDGYGADPGGNLIIRHIRVRSGPPRPDTENFHDAIQLSNNPVLILDHVTASWSVDETVDLFEGGGDITVQWSTIEQSRINPDGPHNYGLIVGPDVRNVSIHHNLFAHHRSRSPAIASGPAEVLNNVDYDVWDGFVHHNPADGEFHIVGNQYLNGPNAENLVPFWFDDEEPGETTYYLADNFVDDPSRDYSATVEHPWGEPYEGFEDIPGEEYATDSPSDFGVRFPVTVQPASEILDPVLAQAGAWPRDAVTVRTVQEVQDRSGEWDAQEPDDLHGGPHPHRRARRRRPRRHRRRLGVRARPGPLGRQRPRHGARRRVHGDRGLRQRAGRQPRRHHVRASPGPRRGRRSRRGLPRRGRCRRGRRVRPGPRRTRAGPRTRRTRAGHPGDQRHRPRARVRRDRRRRRPRRRAHRPRRTPPLRRRSSQTRRRDTVSASSIAITATKNIRDAITLTWTGTPRCAAPHT